MRFQFYRGTTNETSKQKEKIGTAQLTSPQQNRYVLLYKKESIEDSKVLSQDSISVHGYHRMVATRQSASSITAAPLKCRPLLGTPETASGLPVGSFPPRDVIGAGEGPRYVWKKDDVGGGISGGNWCWPAHRNGTMCQRLEEYQQL